MLQSHRIIKDVTVLQLATLLQCAELPFPLLSSPTLLPVYPLPLQILPFYPLPFYPFNSYPLPFYPFTRFPFNSYPFNPVALLPF